jgi:hypothetical protein
MQAVIQVRKSSLSGQGLRGPDQRLRGRLSGGRCSCSLGVPNPCQNRLVIFVAVATDQFLMGAKCCHPSPDFFAQAGVTHGRKRDREGFDTRRGLGGRIDRRRFKPGIFSSGIFRPGVCLRCPRIDRSGKRHGLRDQKIVLLLPIHGEPPAGSDHSKKPAINQAAGFRSPTKSVQAVDKLFGQSGGGDASRKKLWR